MVTQLEVKDLRIERILPYIQNTKGESLDSIFLTIDDLLKFTSPEAMAPGLLNWNNKHLFLDLWKRSSGTGTIIYNEFGASKIGTGRFEINGNGRFYYDRLLAVSEVRGVTGRIFIGAVQPSAIITVGVECLDSQKNLLGSNGGFLYNNFQIPVGQYYFSKDSAFGEANAGSSFLKPGTRYVRLFIEVSNNTSAVYFDESELTTFELDERYLHVFDTNMDWNRSEFFYHEPVISTVYTFSNVKNGKVKNIIIKNTGAADINVDFPTAKWQGGVPLRLIRPGRTSIFTFIKAGNSLYASVIEEME
ncbi:MAG: hypothetical protein PHY47_00255 [Lachnospiraceae bacterium]|nr:hypothetical protein [Lachnospiraceae bacterium]